MFTGLIQHCGWLKESVCLEGSRRLIIKTAYSQIEAGESIAVNGCCLTAIESDEESLIVDVSPETLAVTTINDWRVGDCLNVERAMLASARFGGHIVSGHVDTVARVLTIDGLKEGFHEIQIGDFRKTPTPYLISKGSIAVDGISLTINEVDADTIKVMIIPYTLSNTNLAHLKCGEFVNIEFDYIARVIAHQTKLYHAAAVGGKI